MEGHFEFGQATRAIEMERISKKRKSIRNTIRIASIIVVAALGFAFREDIRNAINPKRDSEKTLAASIDNNRKSKDNAQVSISKKWELPSQLQEISALSRIDDNRLACVQDEEGIIFVFDLVRKSVEKKVIFGGPGDYEGLAIVGESGWVLRSDGRLFNVSSINAEKPVVREYKTPLTASHNTEGLCYDAKNNRLLVAVKEGDRAHTGKKGIYAFDLQTKTMTQQPAYIIDLQNEEIVKASGSSKKKAKEGNEFMPSGIAIHPVSGDIYVTEGRNPKLMVMDAEGNIKQVYKLDKSDFNQPEGITFSSTGNLYISNEGTKKPGNILEVKLK